ncbi:MAG: PilZ domain-containing protein [Kofleriaceae bacterium]
MAGSERRLHHRGAGRPGRRLALAWRMEGATAWRACETRDVGVGGAFLLDVDVAVGATVEVAVPVPARAAPLVIPATVRWASPDGIGVQFRDVDIDILLELNGVLASVSDAPT